MWRGWRRLCVFLFFFFRGWWRRWRRGSREKGFSEGEFSVFFFPPLVVVVVVVGGSQSAARFRKRVSRIVSRNATLPGIYLHHIAASFLNKTRMHPPRRAKGTQEGRTRRRESLFDFVDDGRRRRLELPHGRRRGQKLLLRGCSLSSSSESFRPRRHEVDRSRAEPESCRAGASSPRKGVTKRKRKR